MSDTGVSLAPIWLWLEYHHTFMPRAWAASTTDGALWNFTGTFWFEAVRADVRVGTVWKWHE